MGNFDDAWTDGRIDTSFALCALYKVLSKNAVGWFVDCALNALQFKSCYCVDLAGSKYVAAWLPEALLPVLSLLIYCVSYRFLLTFRVSELYNCWSRWPRGLGLGR